MTPKAFAYVVGFLTSSTVAIFSTINQQDVMMVVGTVSAAILALIPIYQKVTDIIRESRQKDRKARRKDCEEELRKAREIIKSMTGEHHDETDSLKLQRDEWRRLYEAKPKDR